MKNLLNHNSMPVVGFIEPWSALAGSSIRAFISSSDPDADIEVRTLDRDREETVDWPLERQGQSFAVRDYVLGSWVEIPAAAFDPTDAELVFEILFTSNARLKPVVSMGSVLLSIDANGELAVNGHPFASVENERWYRFSVLLRARAVHCALRRNDDSIVGEFEISHDTRHGDIHIGAAPDLNMPTLNARLGRIALTSANRVLQWQFPTRGPVRRMASIEQADIHLVIHNTPTFAVASRRFTGNVHDPRVSPDHFDALHLHDDDFGGFYWAPDLTINIPVDARSGVYALVIITKDGFEKLPFFVRPSEPRSTVAVLLPTATYLAYADERLPPERYPWHGSDRGHLFAIDNNFLSLYDVHSDLSGVSLTSSRRPRATLRDDYHYPLSNSPHLLSVDLQLLKFCGRHGIDIDILTDHDLHADGLPSIEPYQLLLTGSHPEYWSAAMMGALDLYVNGGGSLGYLGGNGFYWVVAFQDEKMELRRGKNDIWSGRPGEIHMAITGEPGGNWEDRGRHHPQALVGVTYVIMSFGPSRPYTRLEGSYGAEFGWLFDGVTSDTFGEGGTVLGAAAGYEVDAILRSEQTPKNLVRLAVADEFDASFQVRPDLWVADGEAERAALRRSDMTVYRHDGGGIVFSASSVAWIGALPGPGEDNDVGRIMRNLVNQFAKA
jgi:N,N-dimethylformamidase